MTAKVIKLTISENNSEGKEDKKASSNIPGTPQAPKAEESSANKASITGEKRIEPLNGVKVEQKDSPATVVKELEDNPSPDSSQIMTSRAEAEMQSPKLFDTKQYHLPISQSVHSYGSKFASIVFGIIFTVILVVIVLYFLQ